MAYPPSFTIGGILFSPAMARFLFPRRCQFPPLLILAQFPNWDSNVGTLINPVGLVVSQLGLDNVSF